MEEKLNYSYKSEEEESVFRGIINKFLPYWPLLLGLIVISVACGWVYLKYATPFYRSSATILIKDDKQGASETSVMETLDMFGGKKNVENEIEVIRSRTLAREVVKDLHLYAPVFVSEKFADKATYNSSPIGIEARYLDSFTVASRIPFVASTANVKVNGVDYAYNQWVTTPWGILRFTPNEKNIKQETDRSYFFALNPVKGAANQLLGRLTVIASSKQSTIINIAYEDDNKKRAEDILNALIRVYNSAAIRDKNTLAANTLDFVEKRLNYVVAELDSVEGKIQDYRTKNKVVNISAQGELYLQTVGANDLKISDLDMQMAVLNEVQRYVAGQSGKGSIIPSTLGITDPVLATQTQRLYELEMQYERLKGTTGENNPAVQSIVDQINKVKPTILENVNNQRRALSAGKQDLAGTNSKYTALLGSIPQKERELL
ncbi:MAG: capsular biosynthesis protein, partial [Chitinophagaceae bacterium]